MKNTLFDNGLLDDDKIISTLHKAIADYQDGNILDVMDELQKIINAIKKYEKYQIL